MQNLVHLSAASFPCWQKVPKTSLRVTASRIIGSHGTPSKFVFNARKSMCAKFGAFFQSVTIIPNLTVPIIVQWPWATYYDEISFFSPDSSKTVPCSPSWLVQLGVPALLMILCSWWLCCWNRSKWSYINWINLSVCRLPDDFQYLVILLSVLLTIIYSIACFYTMTFAWSQL